MQPIPGQAQQFHFQGRTLHLTGKRKDPLLLKDEATGQVLWDRSRHTKYANWWARANFKISVEGNAVKVTDKRRGGVVCECVAVGHVAGDPFMMQVLFLSL